MKKFTPIGGEFWYEAGIIKNEPSEFAGIFLGGGQSALYVICEYLKNVEIHSVLLPEYLCPTILDRLDEQGLAYDFYEVNSDFSINLDSITAKIDSFEAIMFINYFGLSTTKEELEFFKGLKEKGIIVIQDQVQSLSNDNYLGDFVFNSYRKFCPYSGSLLYTDSDVSEIIRKLPYNQNYFELIRRARAKKTEILALKGVNESEYLTAFDAAEESYYSLVSMGDKWEKEMISSLDIEKIGRSRRENYLYLLKEIAKIKELTPVFKELKGKVPLGMPVYMDSKNRNLLRQKLIKEGIFLPVHWNLTNENRIKSQKAKEMASKIVTLVIDQRYDAKDMDLMLNAIKNNL